MCGQIKPERIVDILDRKDCFLDQKSKISKKSKNQNFPKGLVHGFGLQIELFNMCNFWTSEARKDRFLVFWIEKNAFQTRKVKFQKSPKMSKFSRGNKPWFLSINRTYFVCVYFGQIKPHLNFHKKISSQRNKDLRCPR